MTATTSSRPTAGASRADDATHLAPVSPTKILCCHLNHVSRVREFQIELPPAPTWFQKPVSALNAHGGAVVRPANCRYLNYEGEIAIVIGRTARNIAMADAGHYIAGYTIANDFGLHDFRDTDAGSMLRVKGADTLCPIGPGVVTDWDFHHKWMRTSVNGEVRQDGSTDEMAWDMHYLVDRHRPTHHPRARRHPPLRDARDVAAGRARRRRHRRGRGARRAHEPRRRLARPPSATRSARSRPRPKRSSPPRWAVTGSSAVSDVLTPPTGRRCPSPRVTPRFQT